MGASCNTCTSGDTGDAGGCAIPSAPSVECAMQSSAGGWKTRLRVGSASSVFDSPVQMALMRKDLRGLAVSLNWVQCPPDPNAVISMLNAGLVDMAIMWAEDAVASVAEGHPLRLCGTFVATPRTWGIHARAGSGGPHTGREAGGTTLGMPDGRSATVALSVVGDLPSWGSLLFCPRRPFSSIFKASDAMEKTATRITIWEQMAAKPFVTSGEWELLDTVALSWPSMLFVASREALYSKANAITHFINFTRSASKEFQEDHDGEASQYLSARYGMVPEEAKQFISETGWVCESAVNVLAITRLQRHLKLAGLLADDCTIEPIRLLAKGFCRPTEDAHYKSLDSTQEDEDAFGAEGTELPTPSSSSQEAPELVDDELYQKPGGVCKIFVPVPAG